jgi:hypothetical protein
MVYNIAAFAKAKQLKVFTMMVFLEKLVSVLRSRETLKWLRRSAQLHHGEACETPGLGA